MPYEWHRLFCYCKSTFFCGMHFCLQYDNYSAYYASFMLDAFRHPLCSKLYQHNRLVPSSVLNPLMFLCFINDLPEDIKSRIKLYADDVLLYSKITTPDDCHQLQADLHILEQWAKKWNMIFNPSKCEFLSHQ